MKKDNRVYLGNERNKMKKNEFEKDLEIDVSQLDVAAGMQAETFFKWAELSVAAKKEVDASKFRLDTLQAQLASRARTDPESFGIQKVTEAAIDVAVRTSAVYLEAYEVWLEAKAESALLDKAVEALEQKKAMIEKLIVLHGQQYFAGPSVPRDLVSAWETVKGKRAESVMEKTKIRTRG